jgi:hypothetical protein
LNNKKLNFEVLLTDKSLDLDVLCITEHWLGEDETEFCNFRNYSLVSKFTTLKPVSLDVFERWQIDGYTKVSILFCSTKERYME